YNLFLGSTDELVSLQKPVDIIFALVLGKEVTEQRFLGRFVELSTSSAVVESDHFVEPWSNLQIALKNHPDAEDLYAKALSTKSGRFLIRFTLVSPRVEELLFTWVQGNR
ncbi:MAG: hypothetical protein F6K03_13175, partial [Kamptonema sp. SIO4C4]|nr:hypothetical protein [Kamptonema sp. SIO4C4]